MMFRRLKQVRTYVVMLAFLALGAACSTTPERGPAIVVTGSGPISERVQAQVGIVDAKLSAVEELCRTDDGAIEPRCQKPLYDLKRKRAFYRQRAHALITNANTDEPADVAKWQELEIEVEVLTSEVNELADEVKHPSS